MANSATSSTISHSVEAGNGIPNRFSNSSIRANGMAAATLQPLQGNRRNS
jgi:hypothetical protein